MFVRLVSAFIPTANFAGTLPGAIARLKPDCCIPTVQPRDRLPACPEHVTDSDRVLGRLSFVAAAVMLKLSADWPSRAAASIRPKPAAFLPPGHLSCSIPGVCVYELSSSELILRPTGCRAEDSKESIV
jgi:hypothetical protein